MVRITALPRASRWRASAPGIGGRQGRAPLEQLAGSRGACLRVGSIIGDTAMSHVSVPGSMPSCVRARTFVGQRPRDRGRVALTRIRFPRAGRGAGQHQGRRRFAPCSGASRCSASPASPVAMLADARGDRHERRQRKRWCGSRPRLGRRADAHPRPSGRTRFWGNVGVAGAARRAPPSGHGDRRAR